MRKNLEDNESGGNLKESRGKDVEVIIIWACDVKIGPRHIKEGDGEEVWPG